jgi:hypothetical protein
MGGFIGPGCDPDVDPGCLPGGPGVGGIPGPPVVVITDGGTAAALADVQEVVNAVISTVSDLKSLAGLILRAITSVLQALAAIWSAVILPTIKAIKKALDAIQKLLDKVLKPQLEWMRQIRKLVLDFYNKFLRPIITVIQRLRSIIRIFQLLHIHIFDKLDRLLVRIQGKLLYPFFLVLYRLNTLGNWVSFILNAKLLIYRNLFLGSLAANRGGAFNMLAGAPVYGFVAQPQLPASGVLAPLPVQNFASASAAVAADVPGLVTSFGSTPASQLVLCWEQPTGNIDLAGAISDMVNCITA